MKVDYEPVEVKPVYEIVIRLTQAEAVKLKGLVGRFPDAQGFSDELYRALARVA